MTTAASLIRFVFATRRRRIRTLFLMMVVTLTLTGYCFVALPQAARAKRTVSVAGYINAVRNSDAALARSYLCAFYSAKTDNDLQEQFAIANNQWSDVGNFQVLRGDSSHFTVRYSLGSGDFVTVRINKANEDSKILVCPAMSEMLGARK